MGKTNQIRRPRPGNRWSRSLVVRGAALGVTICLAAGACSTTAPAQLDSGLRRLPATAPTSSSTTSSAPSTSTTTVASTTTSTVAPSTTVVPSTTAPTAPAPSTTAALTQCDRLRAEAAGSGVRFYAATTTWTLPASCFGTRSDSARWAANWFNNSNRAAYLGDATQRGHMTIGLSDYSDPIYNASDATYRVRVYTSAYSHNLGSDNSIPWNPSWEPSAGNDHEMIIVDRATGREWGLWLVQKVNYTGCFNWANLLAGYQPGSDLCVGQALIGRNPDGSVSDFRTDSGFSQWAARGLGAVNPLALLPTLDEIESGAIRHALNDEVYNPTFGGACSGGQIGTADAGVNCGYAVAPATRFERVGGPEACGVATMANNATDRSKTVPEGTRFAIDLTDGEIDSWLTSRGYTGAKRTTARVFAVALRDYGWIVSDSTCYDSNMSAEGMANPAAATRWANLGVSASDSTTLLQGLIQGDRIRTLTPPSDAAFVNLS